MTDPFAPPGGDAPTPPPAPPPAWGPPPPPAWGPPPPQQWPQPSAWYGGWQPPRSLNGFAVACLVTGLIGLVPFAIGFGIAALVQIARNDERGRGLAIGGLVAATCWSLLIGLVLALGLTGNLEYRQGDLDDIASTTVGTCLLKHPSRVTDCESPHHYEIYDTYTFDVARWPGADEVDDRADSYCSDRFEDRFGNYFSSDYDYGYFTPNEAQWVAERKVVVCVVLDTFGQTFDHKATQKQ